MAIIDIIDDEWGPKRYHSLADVGIHARDADSIEFSVETNFFLVLLTQQIQRRVGMASSRTHEYSAKPGTTEAIPANADFRAEWFQPKKNILVSVEPEKMKVLAEREFDIGNIELVAKPGGEVDAVASSLATLIYTASETASKDSLYMDSLTTALTLRLISSHAAKQDLEQRDIAAGGLSPHKVKLIVDYLENHLQDSISLSELANLVGTSQRHFLRAFRHSTGLTPYQYLLNLRVERAREMVISTDLPLKVISVLCGFSSRSHLITTMRKRLKATPGQIRAELSHRKIDE